MKKFIAMISACALIIFGSAVAVCAEESEGFKYTLEMDGTISNLTPTEVLQGKIVIPSEIDGHKVKSVNCGNGWTKATEIIFPDGDIELLSQNSSQFFFGCTKLERITIGKGNNINNLFGLDLDTNTQYNNLKEITLNSDVISPLFGLPINGSNIQLNIGSDVELPISSSSDFSAFQSINISKDNQKYFSTGNAVYNKDKTELYFYLGAETAYSIGLLPSTQKIANSAIVSCQNLKELYLPDGLIEIERNNFTDCPNLNTLVIPNSVTTIHDSFFCPSLKTVYIGKNLEYFNTGLFIYDVGGNGWKGSAASNAQFYIYKNSKIDSYMKEYNDYGAKEVLEGVWDLYLRDYGQESKFNYEYIQNISNRYEAPVLVTYNNSYLGFDQPPVIKDDRTLVPLRVIFETLGASVDWNSETQTVTAVRGNDKVTLIIGNNVLYKNGSATELDVSAQIVNDRTLVPARAVAEAFGCNVGWNGDTRTVAITE